jgi:uncharacterized RDD family membrane protein YckC
LLAVAETVLGLLVGLIQLPILQTLVGIALLVLYFVVESTGWSPGKSVLGIQVVDGGGNKPSIRRMFVREIPGKLVATLVFGFGLLWIAWDRRKQGWHDHIAGTFVVEKLL